MDLKFNLRPLGERFEVTEEVAQEGDDLSDGVTPENFVSITIGQGPAGRGYDSVRVFRDGSGYVIPGSGGRMAKRIPVQLDDSQMKFLFEAMKVDDVSRLAGGYNTSVMDGSAGFFEIETREGRRMTWFSNHFEPIENLIGFCNEKIFPKLKSVKPDREGWGVHFAAEFYCVFPGKEGE